VSFSFPLLVRFLAIFQFLECAFLIYMFFSVSRHIQGHTVIVSHFPCFSVFSPKSRSHSVYFSYFRFFIVSRHIQGPAVCVCHFARFSVFLAIFHFLLCVFLIFIICHFSCHIPGTTVCISHFSRFSVFLAIFHFIQFLCLILHLLHFSPNNPVLTGCGSHFTTYSVCFSSCSFFSVSCLISYPSILDSQFFSFLIFSPYSRFCRVPFSYFTFFIESHQVLSCEFLFFFQFYLHLTGTIVCISNFPRFSVFLAIFHVLQCVCETHIPRFHFFFFLPYSWTYNVHFSF
jgi:hypothetical protein